VGNYGKRERSFMARLILLVRLEIPTGIPIIYERDAELYATGHYHPEDQVEVK